MIVLDEIDVSDIPLEALNFLEEIIEGGRELTIPLEEIKEAIDSIEQEEIEDDDEVVQEEKVFTVTFTYKGSVFGTQQVKDGELASKPKLMPAPSGHWDFDFGTPITEDSEIKFVD